MAPEVTEAVLRDIETLLKKRRHILVALDGRCAAGKTTLAAHLQKACGCNVLHMDHFFLRPEQRVAARLDEPGGNVDRERFLEEALIPLKHGKAFSYCPYDCHKREMSEAVTISPHHVNIIEGAYSCHPALLGYYDLTVFLTVGKSEQLRRIKLRNGEACAVTFMEKWIPLEERYFSAFNVMEQSDLCFDTGKAPQNYD